MNMTMPSPKSLLVRCWVLLVLAAFTATACPGLGWLGTARADVQQDLEQAETFITDAEFNKALAILDPMISEGNLSGDSLREAYVLKGRCHALQGQESSAVDAFCNALKADPNWRPDEVIFTNLEMDLYDQAMAAGCYQQSPPQEKSGTPFYKKPLTWIAAAGVVVAALLVGGGGGDDGGGGGGNGEQQLDDFPPPPPEK
jgi:hypothetical protein